MPELRVRAGLLTGETAVNVGAEHEGMVIGDAVNTASRIQALAEPETVFVEDATRRATERGDRLRGRRPHEVKGRDQPVRVWKALRVIAGVGGAGRGGGLEAPFVGRDAELLAIIAAGERVISERRAELVTVIGEAGMGKSRLAWEFEKNVDGIADDVFWHRGRCLSYGEGVSFWALAEIVRMRAGIAENEPAAAAREKLRETVERYVTDERERRLVLPAARASARPRRGQRRRRRPVQRLAAVLRAPRRGDPVVLVFEDLQWADAGLLDFIDHLLEWSARVADPGRSRSRGPRSSSRRPGAGRTTPTGSQPLDDGAMATLLAGLVPGLPDARASARSPSAPRASRCTPSRRCGCCSTAACSRSRATSTPSRATSRTSRSRRRCTRSSPSRLDDLDRDASGGSSRTAPCSARPSRRDGAGRARPTCPPHEVEPLLDGLVAQADPRARRRPPLARARPVRLRAGAAQDRRLRDARPPATARPATSRVAELPRERPGGDGAEDYAEVLATHYAEAVKAEPDAADAPQLRVKARDTLTEAGRRAHVLRPRQRGARAGSSARPRWPTLPSERADLLEPRRARRRCWRGDEDADDAARARRRAARGGGGRPRRGRQPRAPRPAHYIAPGRAAEGIAGSPARGPRDAGRPTRSTPTSRSSPDELARTEMIDRATRRPASEHIDTRAGVRRARTATSAPTGRRARHPRDAARHASAAARRASH